SVFSPNGRELLTIKLKPSIAALPYPFRHDHPGLSVLSFDRNSVVILANPPFSPNGSPKFRSAFTVFPSKFFSSPSKRFLPSIFHKASPASSSQPSPTAVL